MLEHKLVRRTLEFSFETKFHLGHDIWDQYRIVGAHLVNRASVGFAGVK